MDEWMALKIVSASNAEDVQAKEMSVGVPFTTEQATEQRHTQTKAATR